MADLEAHESILTFESDAYSDEIRVVQMSGTEGISSLFSFRLDLAARDSEIDLDAIVGARAARHPSCRRDPSGLRHHLPHGAGDRGGIVYVVPRRIGAGRVDADPALPQPHISKSYGQRDH